MRLRRAGLYLLGVALAIAMCALVLRGGGFEPVAALRALVDGAFGDRERVAVTLLRTSPLLLTGLAVALAFRAGFWNIGAEGQLIVGALAVAWAATQSPLSGWPLAPLWVLLVGALAGAVWGGIAGALRAWRSVPEVISTIMLNFVAIEALSLAVQGPLKEAAGRYPQTDAVPAASELGSLLGVPISLVLGVVLAVALTVLIDRTRFGLSLRAVGRNPEAARAAGVRVRAHAVLVFAASGALAGLAGATEVQGSIHRLYEGYSPGYGFTAIAVALLARLDPRLVIPSALFFGALTAGAESMERVAGVPAVLSEVLQALVVFASVLAWRPPATEES